MSLQKLGLDKILFCQKTYTGITDLADIHRYTNAMKNFIS